MEVPAAVHLISSAFLRRRPFVGGTLASSNESEALEAEKMAGKKKNKNNRKKRMNLAGQPAIITRPGELKIRQ